MYSHKWFYVNFFCRCEVKSDGERWLFCANIQAFFFACASECILSNVYALLSFAVKSLSKEVREDAVHFSFLLYARSFSFSSLWKKSILMGTPPLRLYLPIFYLNEHTTLILRMGYCAKACRIFPPTPFTMLSFPSLMFVLLFPNGKLVAYFFWRSTYI